ncbi:catalase [Chitiniphilus purpureus]|uniref:Catalase n=1 Tax=Chitiniphilus purpureus TaxID=2981137 RepID=A0ABY6DLP0_9NEIS|nr:catalase [Chitiniphilus sp. CD1]UXY15123.1 catalase [Chitiniphilus sp. CD1]
MPDAPQPLNRKIEDLARNHLPRNLTHITTQQGTGVEDDANSLKAGVRGPTLLEDFILREKITHFDHERIPERVVHARGAAAHGYFEAYDDLSPITAAHFLGEAGRRTPVFVRFSTVAGSRGSADTVRDVRGFAVKFYTEQGNFDLVGNNIPVFFIQDAMKFPDLVHAVKPEPHNEIPQAQSAHDTFWDFVSLTPESLHMIMWTMSDRAIPRSYRMMEGFGVHTFRLVNAQGQTTLVKFHWKPQLGVHGMAWDEAQKLNGKDPDFHRRDLWEAIETGQFPEWELGLQLLTEAEAEELDIDVLDPTKIIPEELVPVTRVGRLVLDRNPENFFAETEQVAFHPGHVVPGIDFSNDPLLQGRLFSYTDTQLLRLGGPNFAQLPINRPVCPFHHHQRDGLGQHQIPLGKVAYAPSSLDTGAPAHLGALPDGYRSFPEPLSGHKLRGKPERFADHYSQARLFYASLTLPEQRHLRDALVFELSHVTAVHVRERMVQHLQRIDAGLCNGVARPLGLLCPDEDCGTGPSPASSPALSMNQQPFPVVGRKVAVLAAGRFDAALAQPVLDALKARGVRSVLIGPTLGGLPSGGAAQTRPDFTYENGPSLFFDAVLVLAETTDLDALRQIGRAKTFIAEAYAHGKPIALSTSATPLLEDAGIPLIQIEAQGGADREAIHIGAADATLADRLLASLEWHRCWTRAFVDRIAI